MCSGAAAGKWCSFAVPGDQPVDQRIDDGAGLVFQTAPLDAPLEIAGDAFLDIEVSADQPVAQVAARLVDVAPDSAATRVSYGVFNLTHRDGHAAPVPLVPGQRYRVSVPFKPVAQTFGAGHRIRLAISSTYFPMIWPAPEPVTLTVHPAASALELPVRTASPADAAIHFEPPENGPALDVERLEPSGSGWRLQHDLASGERAIEITDGSGRYRLVEDDITVTKKGQERYSIRHDDPATATGWTRWEMGVGRGAWQTRSVTETTLTATPAHFRVEARLCAWEGDRLVHEQGWDETIPRDNC